MEIVKLSLSTSPLSGRSDDGSGGGGGLGLVLGLGLLRLGDLLLLGGLLGGGGSLLLLLDGLLLLGLLGRLVLRLGDALALDGSTELGERALAGLLLALGAGAGRLVTLAKGEGQGRLALLLVLLGLAVGHSSLSGLSGDGGRAADIDSQGSGGLDGRDDGGSLAGGGSLVLLLGRLSLGLDVGSLLLLLGEDVAEEAAALVDGRLLLGGLGLSLLSGLGLTLSSGLGDNGDLLSSRSLALGDGLDNDGSLGGGGGLLGLGLVLLLLLLAKVEERSALAASGAALGLLDLELVLGLLLGGGLLLGSRLVGLGSSLLSGGGLVLGGLGLVLLGSGLEALNGLLVDLRLSDGGGELLGLGNLGLQLSNPVVALGGRVGLEGVLVALGREVELVRAVGLRLGGISLQTISGSATDSQGTDSKATATYQVDDAMGGLLITNEQKTLASVRSPGDVVLGNLDVLLGLLVGGEDLGLNGLVAEEEEGLAGDEVPVGRRWSANSRFSPRRSNSASGALGLVSQEALLDGLGLLLLLVLLLGGLGLLSLGRLRLLRGLVLNDSDGGSLNSGRLLNGRSGLLLDHRGGDLNGLLFLSHSG
ncbi:hypothetical protein CCMA1212_000803 [Trichoderma ghanense]|uniref:Uncharacterized protein n=1 Tax=Trichoderma ghanense TaxID=65468 RepID=A0ABY2HEW3_9HYPO